MTLSYTGKGGREGGGGGGLKLLAGPTKPGRLQGSGQTKAAPSPPGWGLTTPPRKEQLVTETATTKFAP